MSIPTLDIRPLDPNLKTGPTRMMSGPCRIAAATPGTPYGEFAEWLYIGATADVSIQCWDGTSVTMVGLLGGRWHNVFSTMVNTSGTTATNILWGS